MTIKKFTTIFILFLSFVFLISCANSVNEATGTVKTDLTFRITWKGYSGRGEAIQKIVDSYNEKKDSTCNIIMENGDEDLSTIEGLIDKKSDIIYVLPYRYAKYFGDKGVLTDLTDEFKDSGKLFYPEIWQLGIVNGKTYGIPWLGHSMCLLYNKALLSKAGVDPGSINSLDTLVHAFEAVEAKTDAKGIGLVGADSNDVSWMVNQFIYGYGSSLVSEDGKKVTVNNEKSEAAIEFYKNVLGEYAQPTWVNDTGVEVMDYFRKQEVAFEIQGIWGVTDIQKNGSHFDVGIISMHDIGLCSEVGPMMLAIPASMSEDKKEDAIQFIRYMISKGAQEKIMLGEYDPEHDEYYPFRTPIRIDMADSEIFKTNPDYVKFIKGFQNPSVDVPVPEWETVKEKYYEAGLHEVMNGQESIKDFLNEVETEGDKILGAQ